MEAIHVDPREEEEWLHLVESEESQALLGRMVDAVEVDITEGRTLDFDPSAK